MSFHNMKAWRAILPSSLPIRTASWQRFKSTAAAAISDNQDPATLLRNIGISAHIDSGKTTLTERILFYSGRINAIHEVRGKDGVGAKMDSMDLEREKGITIQSAATYTTWGDHNINIIDTPGHVDFTVEVERALRVLDGAIMVLCGVAGVQSQSITVDRQMKRYEVPRIAFINKLDRTGAEPFRVVDDLREKLRLNATALQVPIGLEDKLEGVVDLITMKALYSVGEHGETIEERDIPENLVELAQEKRMEAIERLAEVDDDIAELFIMEEEPDVDTFREAVRKATLARTFTPVLMGSAFKNKSVQPLLDAVTMFLPSPVERKNIALDLNNNEAEMELNGAADSPFCALAFKLEDGQYGQLTYIRIYQGTLSKGDTIKNTSTGKKVKVGRLVRMHADDMEEVETLATGEICALFGIDCSSGDTFVVDSQNGFNPAMMSMFVPEPVISLALIPKNKSDVSGNFGKALQRFQKEDPTFRVHTDPENKQQIISGMGELHLEVYVERIKREYKVECSTGVPQVNYREGITSKTDFNYLHKKQSGGSGQYGRVVGFMEPMTREEVKENGGKEFMFVNECVGNAMPPEYIAAVEKGFQEQVTEGLLIGHPVLGIKVTLTDGQAHAVDSSELAFRLAAKGAFREAFRASNPIVLEPIMAVQVEVPDEYQGGAVGSINKLRGLIQDTEMRDGYSTIRCLVPLAEMFGYTTTLRSLTQAKGEFSMEFHEYQQMNKGDQKQLEDEYEKKRLEKMKK
mmetsp:Transcript_14599/g.19164  ORF Transcript_14599/g.19164 Transcript_14599/m.19164 type:complete len:747 (-) Transcript_14599:2136-4376(-)